MKVNVKILFILFVFTFCYQTSQGQANIPKIRINPAQAYGGDFSEYFDSVEYIPLETTKESLFGSVSNLIITDSSIVIADNDTHSVFFFSPTGDFIKKIKYGNNLFPNISYDRVCNQISVSLYDGIKGLSKIQYVSVIGDKRPRQRSPSAGQGIQISLGDNYFANFSTMGCFFPPSSVPIDTTYNLIKIYKGDALYKSFFAYNQLDKSSFCALYGRINPSSVVQEGSIYIATPFDNYLYKVNKDSAIKLYQFVFPADRTFSRKTMESHDLHFIDSMRSVVKKDWKTILYVDNIFFNKGLLFFKINPWLHLWFEGSQDYYQYNFVYDTVNKKLISLERINPDAKTYFLPAIGVDNSLLLNHGLVYEDQWLYSSVSSLTMFKAHEAIKSKNSRYPSVLQEYFRTQNRKSNPVITKMRLKGF